MNNERRVRTMKLFYVHGEASRDGLFNCTLKMNSSNFLFLPFVFWWVSFLFNLSLSLSLFLSVMMCELFVYLNNLRSEDLGLSSEIVVLGEHDTGP